MHSMDVQNAKDQLDTLMEVALKFEAAKKGERRIERERQNKIEEEEKKNQINVKAIQLSDDEGDAGMMDHLGNSARRKINKKKTISGKRRSMMTDDESFSELSQRS